ncbi:MAG: di-heme-cytochrome C peroxidase, partial [Isosphaeraceae bacterium]|nr:di-heme-cytochrome C peroxidase [Isosphaeraceae bacterium]
NEVFHQVVTDPAGEAGNANTKPADAPVSYPCLWDTPQHDRVQWNGVAKNAGLGSLGRNVGEVLGVFGDFEVPERPGVTGYASSVRVLNLASIEESLKTLWSPQWPSTFPPIDPTKRDKGRLVYDKARCKDCHEVIDRKDPGRRITAMMVAVGTEARTMDNFQTRTGDAGRLKGAYQDVIPWPPLSPKVIGATIQGEDLLAHTVIGTIIRSGFPAPEDELTKLEYKRRAQAMLTMVPVPPQGGVYKARPLNGVWATAPYLHNGSVASLFQLLLAAKDRLKSFSVGTRQFDPVNVGFQTAAAGFPVFQARSANGTPVPGNSNEGHEFGKELTDEERWQLVEYLKSL